MKIFLLTALCLLISFHPANAYERIISLMPSVTETLFEIGEGEHVIGVTRYCRYPAEAQEKTVVGGLLDVELESVYALDPDVIFMPVNDERHVEIFKKMGLNVVGIETRSVKDILNSIQLIGKTLGREGETEAIVNEIKDTAYIIAQRIKDHDRPKVLMTFLRPMGEGRIREVYIAGDHTYFHDLIEMAGGVNAYNGPNFITSPQVSSEGIMQMNPDVIIELLTRLHETKISKERALADWSQLPDLAAYKTNRIHAFNEPYAGLPGPRLNKVLAQMARLIHPDLDWSDLP